MRRPAKAEVEEVDSAVVEDEAVDVEAAAAAGEAPGVVAMRTFGFPSPSLVAL
jgi:hypothetical protein